MGKVTCKRYGAEFKAKVALGAIRGEQTLAELSAKHGIHQTMIAAWKRQAIEGLVSTFSGKAEAVQATGEAADPAVRQDRPVGGGAGFFGEGPRSMSAERRRGMVEASHPRLSVVRQCALLGISRSGHYYRPTGESAATLALMRLIDEAFLECPYYGSRQMMRHLHRLGHRVGRARVVRLMRRMGLAAIYQKPNTSAPHPEHRVYPYLLRDLAIVRPNQVWCSDITYIPIRWGFLYLVAVMDWHSRRVLSWRLSNTMDVAFCTDALEEALARHGTPEIFNTDQGSQFTSLAFTQALTDADIQISMDGRGRWMDDVFIERLWRSLKYECVYLHAFETGPALHGGLARWISHYNTHRPHSALAGRTPDEAYRGVLPTLLPGHARTTASELKAAA